MTLAPWTTPCWPRLLSQQQPYLGAPTNPADLTLVTSAVSNRGNRPILCINLLLTAAAPTRTIPVVPYAT